MDEDGEQSENLPFFANRSTYIVICIIIYYYKQITQISKQAYKLHYEHRCGSCLSYLDSETSSIFQICVSTVYYRTLAGEVFVGVVNQ